ncbi:MAG: NADH-quinone oxidoreductase subunit C [bacterium]
MDENEKEKAEKKPAEAAAPVPKKPIEDEIKTGFGDAIAGTRYNFGDLEIKVKKEEIVSLCRFLKNHDKIPYNLLRNLTAVDYKDRFEVVYHLCAMSTMENIIVKADVNRENPHIDSVTSVWCGADWQEREVFDLFGIHFDGHPDLRRIMLTDDWEGHPLRKDYVKKEREVKNASQAIRVINAKNDGTTGT